MTYQRKKKRLALWCTAFPEMHKKLRPENSAAGGIKARSQPEAVRMAVYNGIKELFITQNPMCDCCDTIYRHLKLGQYARRQFTDSVHHRRGRNGLLLFDVRYWTAACIVCHDWIHSHPAEAIKLGLLSKEWNKQG